MYSFKNIISCSVSLKTRELDNLIQAVIIDKYIFKRRKGKIIITILVSKEVTYIKFTFDEYSQNIQYNLSKYLTTKESTFIKLGVTDSMTDIIMKKFPMSDLSKPYT